MQQYTTEPPEDIDRFLQHLKYYVEKSYAKNDKVQLIKLLQGASIDIFKTGNWGKLYGHAEAKATLFINPDDLQLINPALKENLKDAICKILQSLQCGLEIIELDFVPNFINNTKSVEEELLDVISTTRHIPNGITLPNELIVKGKEMSEAYLYLYFVENTLRVFIEQVQSKFNIIFPQEVLKTIAKNKSNELQNKFLPLRSASDLYYCDFVQLQQIISNNWEVFKNYFPQRDLHWLRVKIEDMYRVRNLIAHCGYISQEELQMIRSNFTMIIRQLQVNI